MNLFDIDFEINKIEKEFEVISFDCGDEDLNEFIESDAYLYYQSRLSTSYVLKDLTNEEVIGYFSLAHDRISLADFPSNSSYNRFRKQFFSQGKMFKSYPAIKICRLATSKRYRGMGFGRLIINMIISSYQQDNKAGCRFVTVDAYNSALDFYYNHGFLPLSKADEESDTRLLYFDLQRL